VHTNLQFEPLHTGWSWQEVFVQVVEGTLQSEPVQVTVQFEPVQVTVQFEPVQVGGVVELHPEPLQVGGIVDCVPEIVVLPELGDSVAVPE
jgi:hypothetical protein